MNADHEPSLWAECLIQVLDEMRKKNSRTLKFDDVDRLVSEKAANLYPIGDGKYEYRPTPKAGE